MPSDSIQMARLARNTTSPDAVVQLLTVDFLTLRAAISGSGQG